MHHSGGSDSGLLVFTRYPQPGSTKTRLIPALGAAGAAQLQRRLTEHALGYVDEYCDAHDCTGLVYVSTEEQADIANWLGPHRLYFDQVGTDLGQRLIAAFEHAFSRGLKRCVVIGIDCPTLTPEVLGKAFRELSRRDVVIAPASDGGYMLLGMRSEAWPRLKTVVFSTITWGTETVLTETLGQLSRVNVDPILLPEHQDIDVAADLAIWEAARTANPMSGADAKISVIIPCLNEEEHILATLAAVRTGVNVQIVVVDGGSEDKTCDVVRSEDVILVEGVRGRGAQLNAGADHADGDILLFLHADTRVPLGFDTWIRRVMSEGRCRAGAFQLSIDGESRALRRVEWLTALRCRWFRLPYGDQGIFFQKAFFEELGGFPQQPLMEDFSLVRDAKRRAGFEMLPVSVVTSARRWEKLDAFRTTVLNQWIILAYWLGVPPERLAKWYRNAGRSRRKSSR